MANYIIDRPTNAWVDTTTNFWATQTGSAIVMAVVELPYNIFYDPVLSVHEEQWYIAHEVSPAVTELPWNISYLLTSVTVEYWGLKLCATTSLPYGDVAPTKSVVVEWYGDAASPVNHFVCKYNDAVEVRSLFELPWNVSTNILSVVEEKYDITESVVLAVFDIPYELKITDSILSVVELPYYLLDDASTINTTTCTVSINGISVVYNNMNIKAGTSSYCWYGTMTLAKESDYLQVADVNSVSIVMNGTTYNMIVESKNDTVSNKGTVFSVTITSPTALLDSPLADTITQSFDSTVYTKELVETMAAIKGIIVDYQILDWPLPSYTISINDETSLAVIKRVVHSIGGIVQTTPDGTLLIVSAYETSPVYFETAATDYTMSTAIDVNSISTRTDINKGYNAFAITNVQSASDVIWVEFDDVDQIVKGYRVPFSDGTFDLQSSGGLLVTIDKYTYPVTETIPIVVDEGDPEWEVVEFIDNVGSTSLPIYGIVDWEWIDDDLGDLANPLEIAWAEDGTITALSDNVPSESLLRIKYSTKYWKWNIAGPVDKEIQFYVPELEG